MKMKKNILLVEDNQAYADAAKEYLASREAKVILAKDYSQAIEQLKNPRLDGAIIDCFFPEKTGSGMKYLGYVAVQKMLALDPNGRKDTPIARAIKQVGDLLGTEAVKHMLKNIKLEYRSHVDLYWALEQAISADESNSPLGILVAQEAQERGLPLVLATSTHHHDELTQPITDYAGRRGWTLVDCDSRTGESKISFEFWHKVHNGLKLRMRN